MFLSDKGEFLIEFSDNCGGQNKNWTVEAFWLHLIACDHFKKIEHHFALPGHSMMPSDRDFARVGVYQRMHLHNVFTPDHWPDIVSKSCKSFKVYVTRFSKVFSANFCHFKVHKRYKWCTSAA